MKSEMQLHLPATFLQIIHHCDFYTKAENLGKSHFRLIIIENMYS